MSGSGKAGNGRGNSRRRPFRRRDRDSDSWEGDASRRPSAQGNNVPVRNANRNDSDNQGRRGSPPRRGAENPRNPAAFIERPKWIPPKVNTDPLPVPDCPYCGKPIRDLSAALADRITGVPVHFDCVAARIAGAEILEKGDTISYIGGGRFGIVSYGGRDSPRPQPGAQYQDSQGRAESQGFKIKKIIEWENNDKRAEWRSVICDHYSVT